MSLNTRLAAVTANAQLAALAALAASGYLRIYSGAQPATPETGVVSQVLLSESRLAATAFGDPNEKVITANAISAATILATGTAAWFRVLKADGTTVLWDGSVGTEAANLIVATVSFVANATLNISAFTMAIPMQGN